MNTIHNTQKCWFLFKVLVIVFLSTHTAAYADVINGTPGNDYLVGTDGADTISGDIRGINTYFGDDVIYGSAGNDTLYGEYSQAFKNVLDLGSNDEIHGGDGNDTIFGDGGNTSLYTRGNDTLYGDAGDDKLYGYGLDDKLYGGEGNDYLVAGAGDFPGNNEVYGGPGNDHLVNDIGYDILDGGEGYDILDHSGLSFGVEVYLNTGVAIVIGTDQVSGIEEVWGSQMNDILVGSSANEVLKGNNGDDILEGGMGNDTLIGGLYAWGGDTASYEHASSSVVVNLNTGTASGGDGDDTLESIEGIIGSPHADVLVGNLASNFLDGRDGNDTLEGYAGEDNLIGGLGNDTLEGGLGDDRLEGSAGDDNLDGGDGNDELFGDSYTSAGVAGNDTLLGGAGDDKLFGQDGDDNLDGGDDEDTLDGGSGNDEMLGGSGDDDLRGYDGDDTIYGGEGNDTIRGQSLNPGVNITSDNDHLYGDSGDDVLRGDGGDDYIEGGEGVDYVYGDDGNDELSGGPGNDYIDGGYSGISMSIDKVVERADTDFVLTDDSLTGLGNDTLKNIEGARLTGGVSDNIIDATAFTLGSVMLTGGDGSDSLMGGSDDDILIGVQPDSEFPGRGEVDILTGRAGEDRFILGDADWAGYDDGDPESEGLGDYAKITDFMSNLDVIEVQGYQSDYLLETTGIDMRLWLLGDNGEANELIAIIEGVTSLNLGSSAFVFIPAGPPKPEISIEGNGVNIVDGDQLTQASDYTYFGVRLVGSGSIVRTFNIRNTGSTVLNLTATPPIVLSGAHANDFSITTQPTNQISAGTSATFEVTFIPSDEGLRQAVVSINNDDSNENPYDFVIEGSGTFTAAPEISIEGNGVTITDGDNTPSTGDHTDFGETMATSGLVTRTFTIRNNGTKSLNLTDNPFVSISGAHASDFSVVVQPTSPILEDGSTDFQVGFMPSAVGLRQATIIIANDDPERTPYDFVIQGFGNDGLPVTVEQVVTAGGNHSCALTVDRGVKCWGQNTNGQLGDGTTTQRIAPVDVINLTDGVAVTAGFYHTCALNKSGGVQCWGQNAYGQLGDATTTQHITPVDVIGLSTGVVAIASKGYHTCALTISGGVKCWGYNGNGELGDGSTTNRLTPVSGGLTTGVFAVTTGYFHTCAITNVGQLKCWGQNWSGQLGDGTSGTSASSSAAVDVIGLNEGVIKVSGGEDHTCAVTEMGGTLCWGGNSEGQLGDGTRYINRLTPVDVVGLSQGVANMSLGNEFSCAMTSNSRVKCWGDNVSGQLGDGTTTDRITPVDVVGLAEEVLATSAGDRHTCALTNYGELQCWGNNYYGQLGDGTRTQNTSPVDVNGEWWTDPGSPEIVVEGNGQTIADGDSQPQIGDYTDFGDTDIISSSLTHTFMLRNTGTNDLNLTGIPLVTLSGINSGGFMVTKQPGSPVPAGGVTSFEVRFDPGTEGLHKATVSIINDDIDENPYDFVIQGNGTIDSDGDGLSDQQEIGVYGTDPSLYDTDGDGLGDGIEVGLSGIDLDPLSITDPLLADSDGDGYLDGNNGVDPCEDCSNNGQLDAGETDPNVREAFINFKQGLNYFSYPSEIPAEHATCMGLVNALGGDGVIESIARINDATGLYEYCDSFGGVGFPIHSGEAYVVKAVMDYSSVWSWMPVCPSISFNAGMNLIGYSGVPADLSCYSWIEAQLPGTVSTIQRFNIDSGRFESCMLVDTEGVGIEPVGVDFPIRAGLGYLVHSRGNGLLVLPACP